MSTSSVSKPSILLTGASGQVGGELLHLLGEEFEVIAPDRAGLDLASELSIREVIQRVRPRWIVNPAAYTAVDRAETERESAFVINAAAPRVMAEEAARLGIPLLHFSTDYVFPGTGTTRWSEDDAPAPINVYGESKLAGEQAIAASGAAHIILRTSWVYSGRGKNFLLTMLKLARERDELRIVADQVGSPTSAASLARLTQHILRSCEQQAVVQGIALVDAVRSVGGVYHACDAGYVSWFGFAKELLDAASVLRLGNPTLTLKPISTAEFPTPARRPLNSRLNTAKLAGAFGYSMPRWQDSTAEVLREVAGRK